MIADIQGRHPDVLFLAEAFTPRPKLMYRLAKIGFTQSYTYLLPGAAANRRSPNTLPS